MSSDKAGRDRFEHDTYSASKPAPPPPDSSEFTKICSASSGADLPQSAARTAPETAATTLGVDGETTFAWVIPPHTDPTAIKFKNKASCSIRKIDQAALKIIGKPTESRILANGWCIILSEDGFGYNNSPNLQVNMWLGLPLLQVMYSDTVVIFRIDPSIHGLVDAKALPLQPLPPTMDDDDDSGEYDNAVRSMTVELRKAHAAFMKHH